MNILVSILQLAGSLGIFLYGMKLMSEGLQKVAGDRMRSILAAMTKNNLTRVLTGLLVTAVIQSSSATTVMIVSFVNAGLLTLAQSVGVIMGANIGTTITAWLISIVGFKFDISAAAIPLIGIGLPFLFSKKGNRKSIGEFILGFALLFMGLNFLKDSVPKIEPGSPMLEFIAGFSGSGMVPVLIFVLIGTVLTMVIQSSSATMALTLIMCSNGWIPFELAAAMVLGENIGTTITANIAASVANISAKRAARSHLIFNVFGVIWVLLVFHPFVNLIDYILVQFKAGSPLLQIAAIPFGLSLFHTMFNVSNTIILIGFTPYIVKLSTIMVKTKKSDEEEIFRLQYIERGILSTSELSLYQAKQEIEVYVKRTKKMFGLVKELLKETREKEFAEQYKRIVKYEEISDNTEVEIAAYLAKISEGDLSEESGKRLQGMYKMIDNIESIADSVQKIARNLENKRAAGVYFEPEMRDKIMQMFALVDRAFDVMIENTNNGYTKIHDEHMAVAYGAEDEINELRTSLIEEHIKAIELGYYKYNAGVFYSNIISDAEHLGDFIINVSEDIYEIKHGDKKAPSSKEYKKVNQV